MPQITKTKQRFRREQALIPGYTQQNFLNGIPTGPAFKPIADRYVDKFAAYESLTSTGHKGPPYLEGGPFKVTRYSMKRSISARNLQYTDSNLDGSSSSTFALHGGSFVDDSTTKNPLIAQESEFKYFHDHMALPDVVLDSWGAKGVAKYSPLNSGANLGQTVLETLHDGLPRIPLNLYNSLRTFLSEGRGSLVEQVQKGLRSGGGLPSVGSSEYLNYVFGWLPLLKDLRALYSTWNTLNDRLAQIIRDNNKPIRRGGVLYKNTTSETVDPFFNYYQEKSGFSTEFVDGSDMSLLAQSRTEKKIVTSENIWFNMKCHYYIPDVTDDQWLVSAKLALFGAYPSPSLLYEVMPWSWLIDWFTNVGDVINNASNNGLADLVIDYAYVMRHYKRLTTIATFTVPMTLNYTAKGESYSIRTATQKVFNTTILEESKERAVASPFGFGIQLTSLSGRQAAILAALGLSRINFT